jgi:5-aminolevulinate synthase
MHYEQFFDNYLNRLKTDGRYRVFADIERLAGEAPLALWHHDQKVDEIVIWCSNDYMGMSQHPDVVRAMVATTKTCGAGSGGTRNISGTAHPHVLLEQEIADFHKKEAGLIFSSGYVANETTISTLGGSLSNCVIFSDEKNHASLVQGIRNSRATKYIFKHNDINDLETKLNLVNYNTPKLIVFTAVYSMDGDIACMAEISALAKKYNALTYVDEVHAVGMYGDNGAGISEMLHMQDQIDIIQGNFAKGFGVIGGYVTGKRNLIDFIRSSAPGFIFTTSIPPSIAAAALKSIEIIKNGKNLRDQFWQRVNYFKQELKKTSLPYKESPSHIVPIVIKDAKLCKEICDRLLYEEKIYVQPINYPTVPIGQERLRLTVTAAHTHRHIDLVIEALNKTYKRYIS